MIAIEYVRRSNRLISWFEDLVNPVICSLIGDNMNRKFIENIETAGFTIREVKNLISEDFFEEARAKP